MVDDSSQYVWTDNPMVSGESICDPDVVNENLMFLKTGLTTNSGDITLLNQGLEGLSSNVQTLSSDLSDEALSRSSADSNLQQQIDAITASSDVKDIVGTYQDLENYDTSTLGDNDIIKVLSDSTHDNASSYYRYNESTNTFTYIGSESVSYTKSEANSIFVPQTRTINSKELSSNVTLTLSDITNQPYTTYQNVGTRDVTLPSIS